MHLNIIISCLSLSALLLVYVGFRTPKVVKISRSVRVRSAPDTLFAFINNPRLIQEWNPFTAEDPSVKLDYFGPAEGVDAQWSWKGRKSGEGRATIISSEPLCRVSLKLDFKKPFNVTNYGEYALTPQGEETLVTWSIDETAFIPRAISCFINLEKMLGAQFEKGLMKLKALAEAKAKVL